jgi:hypothetical protein
MVSLVQLSATLRRISTTPASSSAGGDWLMFTLRRRKAAGQRRTCSPKIPDPQNDVANITLAEMLEKEPQLKSLFETSFDFVGKETRFIEVHAILAANPKIQDVFVTATGKKDEPVLGWITNAMMAQHTA